MDAAGTPLIKSVLETWTTAPFDELIVVAGSDGEALRQQVQKFLYPAAAEAAADSSKSGGPEPAVKGAQ
ncbi:MAG: hypothetical protein ACM3JH_10920, partial [Acidithiobacillales bacterium]